ncbi:MAG: hypothetical protein ACRC5H_09315 [Treponemataceae bacterium]
MFLSQKIKASLFLLTFFSFVHSYSRTIFEELQPLINDDFTQISDEKLIQYFIQVSDESNRFEELFTYYIENIRIIDQKVHQNINLNTDKKALSEFLLSAMHEIFFKKYNLHSYTASEIKDKGGYNCVSSSILYTILLLRYNIRDIIPIETPDHVFISVNLNNKTYDVETTNKIGFDPGTKKDFFNDFGETTGFAYIPSSNYKDSQKITIKKLVALVNHNKSTYFNTRKNYEQAVIHAEIVQLIRNDEKGDDDYNGALINLISNHIQKKDYEKANNLLANKLPKNLDQYTRLYDAVLFGLIEENYKSGLFGAAFDKVNHIKSSDIRNAALNNICTEIVRNADKTKDYQTGISILEVTESYNLHETPEYKNNRYIMINNYSVQLIKQKQFDEAKNLFYTEWERNIVEKNNLKKIFKSVILSEGNHHFNNKKYTKTIATIKEGLMYLPNDRQVLHNLRNAYIQQLSVLNSTNADAYNQIITEARVFFPREKFFQ